jgi:hypothetical protein
MRRLLVEIVFVSAALSYGAFAQTANSPITGNTIAKLSPQETAQLLGVEGGDFTARTIYSAFFLSTAPGGVVLFETPHAVLPGICEVNVIDVHLGPGQGTQLSHETNDTPLEIAKKDGYKLFTVAGELNGSRDWGDVDKQHAEALCRNVKIETDMFSRNAVDNLFSADSAELAQGGARALDAVVTAAADKAPLDFKISCDGAAQFCASPRDELAKLSVHNFESIASGDCNTTDQICYHVAGGDSRADWSADIAVVRQAGTTRDRIVSVKFRESLNPIE